MEFSIERQDQELRVTLQGRLDTVTTPEVNEKVTEALGGSVVCILEAEGLEYISSAGLRLLLLLHKRMAAAGGRLLLRNVRPGVRDILEMTGFASFLAIE